VLGALRRTVRTIRLLARDGRIPKPLRGLVALGVLPVPGPFDEAVLLLAAVLLFAFYRPVLRESWIAASGERQSSDAPTSSA